MRIVGQVLIDPEITTARFSCDVSLCRGACCTLEGGRGAPITDSEAKEIERIFPVVSQYLPASHLDVIRKDGLHEGPPGARATTCVDNKACVFSYVDAGVNRCSFERAFLDGRSEWRKPLSCHLFPLRIRNVGADLLRYERIPECKPGRDRGERENVMMYEFLQDALTRSFGESWYQAFRSECDSVHAQSNDG